MAPRTMRESELAGAEAGSLSPTEVRCARKCARLVARSSRTARRPSGSGGDAAGGEVAARGGKIPTGTRRRGILVAVTAGSPDLDTLLAHADWLSALSRQLCRDQHAAADATQDTLLAALQRPPQRAGNVRGFLATVLRNTLRRRARADVRVARRERAVARAGWSEAAAETAARAELQQFLGRCVLELPEPQRALVLWHYFEGQDVAVLARRAGMSADAVRAHLRRARDTLRARLQQSEGAARRGFALLLAAEGAKAVLVPGVIMALTMQAKIGLAAAATAAAAWLFWGMTEPAPDPLAHAGPATASAPAAGVLPPAADRTSTADAPQRTEVATAAALSSVSCRLVGLHPGARWTATVSIELEGRDESQDRGHQDVQEVAPAVDGTFTLRLPTWTNTCTAFAVKLRAEDPLYLPIAAQAKSPTLAASPLLAAAVYEIPVQVAPELTGRVVDFRGEPVPAARVCAFALREGLPVDALLDQTNTAADGTFVLQVPASADVLALAIPMVEAVKDGHRIVGWRGAIQDRSRFRDDLLPASQRVAARLAEPRSTPDLVLRATAFVEGEILRSDRKPFPATIQLGVRLCYTGDAVVKVLGAPVTWWRDGTCAIETMAAGHGSKFRIRGAPARPARLELIPFPGLAAFRPIERDVVPPCVADLVFPGRELHLALRIDGNPAPDVVVRCGFEKDWAIASTDHAGEVRLMVPSDRRFLVRTAAKLCANQERWIEVDEPLTDPVLFELTSLRLAPVAIACTDVIAVGAAHFTWDPIPPTPGDRGSRLLRRAEDGLFHLELPAGRFRLTIQMDPDHARFDVEASDLFLVRTTREIDVPDGGARFELPTTHGGRIRIQALDAHGLRVEGVVRLAGPDGKEATPSTCDATGQGLDRGKLRVDGPTMTRESLAPGRYEVVLDLGAHGIHRRTVEVKACEVAEVKLTLP